MKNIHIIICVYSAHQLPDGSLLHIDSMPSWLLSAEIDKTQADLKHEDREREKKEGSKKNKADGLHAALKNSSLIWNLKRCLF